MLPCKVTRPDFPAFNVREGVFPATESMIPLKIIPLVPIVVVVILVDDDVPNTVGTLFAISQLKA